MWGLSHVKNYFHLRAQIQIPPDYCGGIGRFLVLLVRIAFVAVADLGRGGAAGGVDGAAFGAYRGPQGDCGGENLAVILGSLAVSVRHMFLLVGTNPGGRSLG